MICVNNFHKSDFTFSHRHIEHWRLEASFDEALEGLGTVLGGAAGPALCDRLAMVHIHLYSYHSSLVSKKHVRSPMGC